MFDYFAPGSRVFDTIRRQFGTVRSAVVFGFPGSRQIKSTIALDDGLTVDRWLDEIAPAGNLVPLPLDNRASFIPVPTDDGDGPRAA